MPLLPSITVLVAGLAQRTAPNSAAALPRAQGVHVNAPGAAEKDPGKQGAAGALPDAYQPAGEGSLQYATELAPRTSWVTVPAGHAVHPPAAPAELHVLGGQRVHAVAPAPE